VVIMSAGAFASTGIGARPRAAEAGPRAGVVGLLIFLGTEAMFFAGLMSAFVILRAGVAAWPPPGQPRLPRAVTGLNTLVLLASAGTMNGARRRARAGRARGLGAWLAVTAALGATFLAVQGAEWMRLVRHGLTATSSVYGALFYTLIGAHAVHVLGALVALLVVTARALGGRYSAASHAGVELCWMYWWFVVGLWPVLYALVYLSP
jgi:cytochrome c oxidase subunit 3